MIPYGRHDISQEDIDAVVSVLRSDWLTQGPAVPAFEKIVAEKVGAKHGVAVNSATSALHIACLALGLGPGDWLWTVPNTFVASANCGLYCGAKVDFVDIEPDTGNIDIEALKRKLVSAKKADALPKIVVPVHFAGQPPDQEAIAELAREYGFKVIEDASHAIGASYKDEPVGSCRWSAITVFSFHPVKIITSGEGGMALTNDAELSWRMTMLRSHGITREQDRMEATNPPPWAYEQQMLGFNYRMTDIQAVLGVSQMARLAGYVERREQLARQYDDRLAQLPLKLPHRANDRKSSWHLYVVRLSARNRLAVFNAMRSAGIGVNVHYSPVHLQPYYRRLGFASGQYPGAEAYGAEAMTLPLHPKLSAADFDAVVAALATALADG
jgi:UDP-4-amino-4,6-dideoxy-N-acetyl-beta-L-altrosamine transaminase